MRKLALLTALLALTACASLQGDVPPVDPEHQWPQWRGPTWNGVAAHGDPPVTWSETENVRWKVPVEMGHGTPVVWGDRLFLMTATPLEEELPIPDVIPPGTPNINEHPQVVGTWKAQRMEVLCLDRHTGEELWRRVAAAGMPHQGHHNKGGFASASPITDGAFVYTYFGSFGLYCYDLDGELIWTRPFVHQAMEDSLGEGSSPALHGDTLVIAVDTERQSFVHAIDKHTGEELWRTERDETSNWSTPRILEHEGRWEVVLNGATVRSYDLETGELLWECGGHTASAIPVPAVGHGHVYTASGWRKDVLQAIRLGGRGDLTGGEHVSWTHTRGVPYVPCPVLWGDELYLLEDQSFLTCLDARTGEAHYPKTRLPEGPSFSASPVGAAGRLYLTSEEGLTLVVQRGPEYRVLATNRLDDRFHASPIIVGDRMYLRGFAPLYCIAAP